MLIAVTGPDGAGKSTICKKMYNYFIQNLNEKSVTISSVWDNYEDLFFSQQNAQNYLKKLDKYARSLFILHAIQRTLDIAKKKEKKIIIIDSYWYKYIVSEIALGVPRDFLLQAIKIFPKPDLTLYLEISPEVASQRKSHITEYEQGIFSNDNGKEQFINFQSKLQNIWKEIEFISGPWFHISGQQSPEKILKLMATIYLKKVA